MKNNKKAVNNLKGEKGVAPIISFILLLGFAIALAVFIFLWQFRQTEELSESVVSFVEGGIQCENIQINVHVTDPSTCAIEVVNSGFFNIEKLNIRKLYTGDPKSSINDQMLETKTQGKPVEQYTAQILTGYCGDIEIMPLIKIGENLAACKDRTKTVNCRPCQGIVGSSCGDIPHGGCSSDKLEYCENGVLLAADCDDCGCTVGKHCKADGSCEGTDLKCSDDTLYGSCSSISHKYCDSYGVLKNNYCYGQDKKVGTVDDCGCPSNEECQTDGTCKEKAGSETCEESEVGYCSDGLDNDCDGESDYDNSDGITGDYDCPVGVTSISVSSSTPIVSSSISVDCTSSVSGVNSINASVSGVGDCSFNSWSDSIAKFDCNVGSSVTTRTVSCFVDTYKSYKSGDDKTTTINVLASVECHKGCYENNIHWLDPNNKPLELVQSCNLDCGYWPVNVICHMRADGKVEELRYPECFERVCRQQADDFICYSRRDDSPKDVSNIEQTKAVSFTFTDSKQLYNSNPQTYFYVGAPVGQDLYGYGTNVKFIDPEKPKIINTISTGSTTMNDGSNGPSAIWKNNVLVMNPNAKSTGLYRIPTRILSDLIPLYQKNNILPWNNEANPQIACKDKEPKIVAENFCINLTHAKETKYYYKYQDKCEQSFRDSFFYTNKDLVFASCLIEETPYKTEISKYIECGSNTVCGSDYSLDTGICGMAWYTREQFLKAPLMRNFAVLSLTKNTHGYVACKVSFDVDGGRPLCCNSGCARDGKCKPEGTTATNVYGPIDSSKYGNTKVKYVCKGNKWEIL